MVGFPFGSPFRPRRIPSTRPRPQQRQRKTIGVLLGEIDGSGSLFYPPDESGIAMYLSTKTTKQDAYEQDTLLSSDCSPRPGPRGSFAPPRWRRGV